jgi:hypothetical protein
MTSSPLGGRLGPEKRLTGSRFLVTFKRYT